MSKQGTNSTVGVAYARFLWLTPSKVRRVIKHIKYRPVQDAMDMLEHIQHRSATQLQKIIKSAAANCINNNPNMTQDRLYIQRLTADEGPRVKRLWRRGRGRADVLLKRMCHLTTVVGPKEQVQNSRQHFATVQKKYRLTTQQIDTHRRAPKSGATVDSAPHDRDAARGVTRKPQSGTGARDGKQSAQRSAQTKNSMQQSKRVAASQPQKKSAPRANSTKNSRGVSK